MRHGRPSRDARDTKRKHYFYSRKKCFCYSIQLYTQSKSNGGAKTTAGENRISINGGADSMRKVNKKIIANDGYELEVCLWLPENENIQKLVLYINSSGPHTYINTFKWTDDNIYHYQEYFAEKFCENNIAYCTYSTRGVHLSDESPFLKIKMDEYKTYLLSNSILDIEILIDSLKCQKELKHTQIYLFGVSEGTMIAPLFALKHPGKVNGLLLTGYASFNMKDILIWQNNGGASMVWFKRYFDKDGDGKISKEEYMQDPYNMAKTVLNNTSFEQIDVNKDGVIDKEDFAIILKERLEGILSAIEKKDDKWLLENYSIPLTTEWFRQYFEIKSNFETLQKLNLSIAIFHGEFDQNVDVKGVYAINEKFIELGKTNLSVKVYSEMEHDIYFANIVDITQCIEPITDLVNTVKGW